MVLHAGPELVLAATTVQRHCRGWSQQRRMLRSAHGLAVVDDQLARRLQRHQWLGVKWMYRVANGTFRGCILADDPGLGKTLQALALIEALIWSRQAARVLVVCPATLVHVWRTEASKWLQQKLTVLAIQKESQELHARALLARLARTRAPEHHVMVVSFECLEKHRDVLCGMGQTLDLKIVDEAHRCAHDNLTSRAVAPPESYAHWLRFEVGVGTSSVDLPQPIKPIISTLLIQPQDVIASIENMELVVDGDGENEGDDAACEVTIAAPLVGAGGAQPVISYIFHTRSDSHWTC